MFRFILQNSKTFNKNKRFFHISTSNLSATNSDEYTEILQKIKKDESTNCEGMKRLVQAEVRNNHLSKKKNQMNYYLNGF